MQERAWQIGLAVVALVTMLLGPSDFTGLSVAPPFCESDAECMKMGAGDICREKMCAFSKSGLKIIQDQVVCRFHNSGDKEKCHSSNKHGDYSCVNKGKKFCEANVRGRYGDALTWKSSCGGTAYSTVGKGGEVVFNCKPAVKSEVVRCVFKGSKDYDKCRGIVKGTKSSFGCGGKRECETKTKGKKGEVVRWESSCGGKGKTVIDGRDEKVVFRCKESVPGCKSDKDCDKGDVCENGKCVGTVDPVVSDVVHCIFNNNAGEKCYTQSSAGDYSCVDQTNNAMCKAKVKGFLDEKLTWKSSCGGYAYTVVGKGGEAEFDCSGEKYCTSDRDCPILVCIKEPCPVSKCKKGSCVVEKPLEPQCKNDGDCPAAPCMIGHECPMPKCKKGKCVVEKQPQCKNDGDCPPPPCMTVIGAKCPVSECKNGKCVVEEQPQCKNDGDCPPPPCMAVVGAKCPVSECRQGSCVAKPPKPELLLTITVEDNSPANTVVFAQDIFEHLTRKGLSPGPIKLYSELTNLDQALIVPLDRTPSSGKRSGYISIGDSASSEYAVFAADLAIALKNKGHFKVVHASEIKDLLKPECRDNSDCLQPKCKPGVPCPSSVCKSGKCVLEEPIVIDISETATCVFKDSKGPREKCYVDAQTPVQAKTGCNILTGTSDRCSVKVLGAKGKTLHWKASCSGRGKTVIDGQDETMTFDCSKCESHEDCRNAGKGFVCQHGECVNPLKTPVRETVKCNFENSSGGDRCYTRTTQGEFGCIAGNSSASCKASVGGLENEEVTWKSSCGQYQYTIMDGESENVSFQCYFEGPLPGPDDPISTEPEEPADPIIYPHKDPDPASEPIVSPRPRCDGCVVNGRCLPVGVRDGGNFCTTEGEFRPQKPANVRCDNSFECDSNLCTSGSCMDSGVFKKLLRWLGLVG